MPMELRRGNSANHLVAFLSCFVNDLEEEEEVPSLGLRLFRRLGVRGALSNRDW